MKKVITCIWILCLTAFLFACTDSGEETTTTEYMQEDLTSMAEGAMSYEEFVAAETGAPVVIDVMIQEIHSWEDSRAALTAADDEGSYYIEEMICPAADYEKLKKKKKIRITGYKTESEGHMQITDAAFEFLDQ